MIKLTQLSKVFEDSLNELLGNPEIQFKIWAEAGQFKRGHRDGNKVTYYINGNLRTSTSANEANDLVMGVNGLSLEFAIPIQCPKTSAKQTEEELQRIQDGQYPFVHEIFGVIDSYFQTAKTMELTDETGVEFSVSFQAGTSLAGVVDILPVLGECITASVYIEVYFIAGGINSKKVAVTFDGKTIPFQAVRFGRSPMIERDIYAGELISKSIVISTAFSIDAEFPVTDDPASQEGIDYLLSAEPNVAHFVNVKFGKLKEKTYLMTFNTVQTSASGIAIAGASVSLMEVVGNISAINVPASYQMGKFTVSGSDITQISFTPSVNCLAFVAGKVYALTAGAQAVVSVTPEAIDYNEDAGAYAVYIITDSALNVTNSSAPFGVVKAVNNG